MGSLQHPSWQLFIVLPSERRDGSVPRPSDPTTYASAAEAYAGLSFKDYAAIIDRFPDDYFDVVQVDGRCRSSCAMHAIPKIKPGGYLIVDDFDLGARYSVGLARDEAPEVEVAQFDRAWTVHLVIPAHWLLAKDHQLRLSFQEALEPDLRSDA